MSARAAATPPLWPPLLAGRGRSGDSAPHAHHALHLVLARTGELRCELADRAIVAAGVITAPDVRHRLVTGGAEVLLVFLDPESEAGRALIPALHGPARGIAPSMRDALDAAPEVIMSGDGVAWAARAAALLGAGDLPVRRIHPGVRRALGHLRGLEIDDDTSLRALAGIAGLSEGRFMHAFTASVGIPVRPYLAWLKLQRAASALLSGATVTAAAHAAGFADGGHLTRAFRRMFGMPPSALRGAAGPEPGSLAVLAPPRSARAPRTRPR